MDLTILRANIDEGEGFRDVVYDDATGRPLKPGDTLKGYASIGSGINLHEPIPKRFLDPIRDWRIDNACQDLNAHVPGWRSWPHSAGNAIAEMAYALGWPRLAGFNKLLTACNAGDWKQAAAECLDSAWARQVGQRSLRIAGQFRAAGG